MIDSAALAVLLAGPESDRVERTESLRDSNKFCEAICAFANDLPAHGQPGYLVIGVDSRGRPTGADISEQLLEQLAAHRSNGQIIPPPVMNVARVELGDAAVAVVEVFPSPFPPVRYKGVTHVRVGPRRGIATREEEQRLAERQVSHAATWDLRPCLDATLDDLALDIFRLSYLPHAVAADVLAENERSVSEQMAALRLFHSKKQRPTNAAVLLFAKDPLTYAPGAYVQYVSFDGKSHGDDVLQEQRIDGDLVSVLRELDQLATRLAGAHPLRQADLSDRTAYHYPPIALHELFMNAVIHRKYEESTTPISINHFVDRMEIQNPGGLYGDLTRAVFPRGTSYRNPVIAEAAKTLGFVNRFGRGIAIAKTELQKNGSPDVEFDIGESHFAAIVRERT